MPSESLGRKELADLHALLTIFCASFQVALPKRPEVWSTRSTFLTIDIPARHCSFHVL